MSVAAARALRYQLRPSFRIQSSTTTTSTVRPARYPLHTSSRLFQSPLRQSLPRKSAVDPLSLLALAAVSGGILYLIAPGNSTNTPRADETNTALGAQTKLPDFTMSSPQLPPGRPGNLTAEQQQKLKDLWAATLDVFGVSNETNGSIHSATDGADKKKRKGRSSLFGKKDDGDDDDKHGQKKEFQEALAQQTPEELREAFWSMSKHDHPDALLLRFLRARKWDVHAALVMFISTLHWRQSEMHVDDDIMLKGEGHAIEECKSSKPAEKKEGEDFMAQLRMGKSFLHGTDKDGRPCCYVRVKLHKQGEQSEKSLERFTVYTIESARLLLGSQVDTATIVFDMTDFSMSNMDYVPVKFMIKCFEANYPESLGSVLVYKSPWLFQGIWRIIKGWLDPVVAAKVHFCSNVSELSSFIPKERIPTELGGDEKYTYKYIEPSANEDRLLSDTTTRDNLVSERKDIVKQFENETISWIHGEAVGDARTSLAERLAKNYWQVDPYVRARSLYDRTGVINAGGKIVNYPSEAPAASTGGQNDDLD